MPFYLFKCPQCGHEAELLVRMGTESTQCTECSAATAKQMSYRFNATGLPNGFSSTRSQSRKETK